MKVDIDKLFQILATDGWEPLPDRDAEIWAEALRRARMRRERRRQERLGRVLAAGLCVVILCLSWRNVGTEDFSLVITGRNPDGSIDLRGRNPRSTDEMQVSTSAQSAQDAQDVAQQAKAHLAGGDYTLTNVRGTTIRGYTSFLPIAEVQTSSGPEPINIELDIPFSSSPTESGQEEAGRFLLTRYADALREIKAGRARRIDTVEREIANRVIRWERWSLYFPEFGEVTFWDGKPLPDAERTPPRR